MLFLIATEEGRLYLDQEKGHTIGFQGPTKLDETELCVQLSHTLELAVLLENLLVDFLDVGILGGKEVRQARKSNWFPNG